MPIYLDFGLTRQLDKWEDAKAVVTEFAWVEHLCDVPCRAFWEDSGGYLLGVYEESL